MPDTFAAVRKAVAAGVFVKVDTNESCDAKTAIRLMTSARSGTPFSLFSSAICVVNFVASRIPWTSTAERVYDTHLG